MKILKLTLKNLNSLSGLWVIDFDQFPLGHPGPFAITGPTGSGKSTIFDAITLSLYGQTPRLTHPAEEILSHQASEAMAEIIFQVKENQYCSQWMVERKKNSSHCKTPKMILSQLIDQNFKIIEEKSKNVPVRIAEILGLDFAQFTRAVLLAQDSFATFLTSKGRERAVILEKLTGTQLYSLLGMKAYEKFKKEEEKYFQLEKDLERYQTYDENNITLWEINFQKLKEKIQATSKRKEELSQHEKILTTFIKLSSSQQQLEKEIEQGQRILQQRSHEFSLLDLNLRLAPEIQEDYHSYGLQQESLKELGQQINDLEIQDHQRKSEEKKWPELLAESEKNCLQLEKEVEEWETIFKQVENLDLEISRETGLLHHLQQSHQKRKSLIEKMKQELNQLPVQVGEQLQFNGQFLHSDLLKLGHPCPLCGTIYSGKYDGPLHPSQHSLSENDPEIIQQRQLPLARKKLETELAGEERLLLETQQQMLAKNNSIEVWKKQRVLLFADKNPDSERRKIKENLREKSKVFQDLKSKFQVMQAENQRWPILLQNLKYQTEKVQRTLTQLEQRILAKANLEQISSMEQLAQIILSVEKKNYLLHEREKLLGPLKEKRAVCQKIQEELKEIPASLHGQVSTLKTLQEEIQDFEKILGEDQKNLGVLEEKIRYHKEISQQKKLLEEKVAEQKQRLSKWYQLKTLIGSASGDHFRKFAQGLTLDHLLNLSNRYLRQLNNRYQFERRYKNLEEGADDLDIFIRDYHQNFLLRSTDNISGGERFLLSLALALGLADLGQKKIRLESLFLDEGFGGLDPENLQKALETLENLKYTGKVIGIITHVEGLKEKIPVQIQIKPQGGGKSSLSVTYVD